MKFEAFEASDLFSNDCKLTVPMFIRPVRRLQCSLATLLGGYRWPWRYHGAYPCPWWLSDCPSLIVEKLWPKISFKLRIGMFTWWISKINWSAFYSAGTRKCGWKMFNNLYDGVCFRFQMFNHASHGRILVKNNTNASKLSYFRVWN